MADEGPPPRSRDLIDQSDLLKRRAAKLKAESAERIARIQHRWQHVALGRICAVCQLVQPTDEFEDESACKPKRAKG